MKKIALILCLVLVASFVLSGCNNSDSIITLEDREVRFGDRMVDADGLSEETLEWLDWYNSLPEEQQLAISAVPPDLLEESGLVKTEDAEVSAQEDELCGYPLAPEEVE